MESFKNCSLVGLVLLLAVCACLAMPKWIQVEEDEAMMKENYGDFTNVRTARGRFNKKMALKLNDKKQKCPSKCPTNCPSHNLHCKKCCGKKG